jgi:hypothetical protein
LLKGGQVLIGALIGGHDGGLAQRLTIEVLANPGHPLIRNKVLDVEIDHLGFEVRAIFRRGVDAVGERGGHQAAGDRTAFDLGLVFGHFQGLLRQLEDLALLVSEHGLLAQGAAAAPSAGTAVQPVNPHAVGLSDRLESPARVPWLPAGSAAGFLAEGLGGRFG